ncbi:hypothetical protein BH23GEM6_BH23GEM6_09570 [soil metagenome]
MRSFSFFRRAAVAALVLPVMIGCQDELPTATGGDLFPAGTRPSTVDLLLEAEQFLLSSAQQAGFSDPAAAGYLLVAREFEQALTANALVRFAGFPENVTYTVGGVITTTDDFTYQAGRVVARIDAPASAPVATQLRLWALAQPWDTAGVSWTTAAGRTSPTPWATPGGTRGQLLAQTMWTPGDTAAAADSVIFAVDSLTVARMAAGGFNGLLVTSETAGSRVQLSRFVLQTGVRPAAHPDTAVAMIVPVGPQTFIFTPQPPSIAGTLRVGGLEGDRGVIRLNLSQQVPSCSNPAVTPNCPMVPLREVMINRASLVLSPLPTPGGLRPLQAPSVRIRRVLEPDLGRFAPLGELIFADTLPVARFTQPAGEPIIFDMTRAFSVFTAGELGQVTIAVLAEQQDASFGYLYFSDRPRLRIVYTLPVQPTFP